MNMKPYQEIQRALAARRVFPPQVRKSPMDGYQLLLLYNGIGKPATAYLRRQLSMKEILAGRRATLPWRRIYTGEKT